MADEYQSKYFSGEEIDEILYKAKVAEDSNYGLGEYYKKDEVDSKIGDGVPTKMSELENDSGYVSQNEINSETDTIRMAYGYKFITESYDISPGDTITIGIEEDDVRYMVDASDTVIAEWMGEEGGVAGLAALHLSSFDLYDWSDDYVSFTVWNDHTGNVSTTITRIKKSNSVIAGVKESSISLKHLNDEVINKFTGGSTPSTITKENVDDTIITEDDIASTEKAGIVKISSYGGLDYINAAGGLVINGATEDEIQAKSLIFKPVAVEYMDYAIMEGTHQSMSDDYDVSSFRVGSDMDDKQGQLPVSYDAVKGYVDSAINNAIGVVLGGES